MQMHLKMLLHHFLMSVQSDSPAALHNNLVADVHFPVLHELPLSNTSKHRCCQSNELLTGGWQNWEDTKWMKPTQDNNIDRFGDSLKHAVSERREGLPSQNLSLRPNR